MTRLSPSAAKKNMNNRIVIGKVGAAHGIHGEMRIIPLTDFADRFNDLKEVMVGNEILHIESVKYHKKFVLIRFKEYPVRENAMQLTGSLLTIDRSEAVPLSDGEYYIFDIVGLDVFDMKNQKIGTVDNVFRTGSNDVYQVRSEAGQEILIPALKKVVKEIDIAHSRMVVELLEDETSCE